MALPLPPQVPVVGMGPGGGFLPSAPGTLPYQQNPVASILSGVANAVKEYRAQSELEKQQAWAELQRMLEFSKSTGIGLDPKAVKKTLDKAGMKELDWDGFSAQQYQQQIAQQESQATTGLPPAQMQMQMGGPGGAPVSMQPQPMPPFAGSVADVSSPAALQQAHGQFARATGQAMPPAAPPATDGLAAVLQMIAAGGRSKMEMEKMQSEAQRKQMTLLNGALDGNEKALTILRSAGIVKGPEGYQALLEASIKKHGEKEGPVKAAEAYFEVAGGGMQRRLAEMEALDKAAQRDLTLRTKMNEMFLQYSKEFPNAPQMGIQAAVVGQLTGNTELWMQGMTVLGPSKTQAEEGRAVRGEKRAERQEERAEKKMVLDEAQFNLEIAKFKDASARGWQGLDLQQKGLVMEAARLQNAMSEAVSRQLGSEANRMIELMNDKDASEETRNAAMNRVVDALNQEGELKWLGVDSKGKLTEKTYPLAKLQIEEFRKVWGLSPWSSYRLGLAGAKGPYGKQAPSQSPFPSFPMQGDPFVYPGSSPWGLSGLPIPPPKR